MDKDGLDLGLDFRLRGIDVLVTGNENEFTPGERVYVPLAGARGVFVRRSVSRSPTAWVVDISGQETVWRRIEHLPVLDRLADI